MSSPKEILSTKRNLIFSQVWWNEGLVSSWNFSLRI